MSFDSIKSPINLANFEIMKVGAPFMPAVSVSSPGAGQFGGGTATTTIAHGLGYNPIIISFLTPVSSGRSYPMAFSIYSVPASSQAAWYNFECYADANNVYLFSQLTVYGAAFSIAANAYQVQYYLLRENIKRLI